jgi:hypothetical protein
VTASAYNFQEAVTDASTEIYAKIGKELRLLPAGSANGDFLNLFLPGHHFSNGNALEIEPTAEPAAFLRANAHTDRASTIRALAHFSLKKSAALRTHLLAIRHPSGIVHKIADFAKH